MPDNSSADGTGTWSDLLNQANQLHQQGRFRDALTRYIKLFELQPDNVQVLLAIAWLHRQLGNARDAAAAYSRIIELQPAHAEALNALGTIYHEHGGIPQAANCYQQAIKAKPDFIEAHNNLGGALQRLYLIDDATRSYRRALELRPNNPLWELRIDSLCRPVANSQEESESYRSFLAAALDRYTARGLSCTPDELVQTGAYPSYSLMYHGLNDRPIREAYARVFEPCFDEPKEYLGSTGKNRIGFVVTTTHEALFVRSMGGVLRHMDTGRFELTIICGTGRQHQIEELLNHPKIQLLPIPDSISEAAEVIRQARFDILYYWEIATDPLNYFLPFFRLAPVQCTSWGIQVTSGIPHVDYYLSSKLVEPEDAQSHYTEKLICADTLLTYQYRPTLPKPAKTRVDFGFQADQHLYLFPQQMGKFHPDFDRVTGDILRRDPKGVLVILQGLWPYTAQQLQARLSRTIPDVVDRVVFLPRLDRDDLLCLIADSEVLLDPPHYGGVNSSYDGFSMNTPILTCESPYHIGRYTAACYRKMGLEDCIADSLDSYVDMATELGTNPQSRQAFSDRIRESSPKLFEDAESVHEHERIFEALINRLKTD